MFHLISGMEKNLCIRGVYLDILSKTFCLTVPKTLVHESFSVSLISGVKKLHALEG